MKRWECWKSDVVIGALSITFALWLVGAFSVERRKGPTLEQRIEALEAMHAAPEAMEGKP